MKETRADGIVISKELQGENNLLLGILFENGNFFFKLAPGSRGGGKNFKGSMAELGFCLSFITDYKRKLIIDGVRWKHENIRHFYPKFEVLCFFLRYISYFSKKASGQPELFNLLSNSLYYLDLEKPEKEKIALHKFFFLSRLIYFLGFYPDCEKCQHCDAILSSGSVSRFEISLSGFLCTNCFKVRNVESSGFFDWFILAKKLNTKDWSKEKEDLDVQNDQGVLILMENYLSSKI